MRISDWSSDVCSSDLTHRNEGEHVEALVADREPGAREEGPARPENDGGREQHLNPVARLATDIWLEARQMAAHFERDDGKGEKESDPEASPHIAIFFAGAVRCGRHDRLKCHATDGAASGTGLLDFGMHRA